MHWVVGLLVVGQIVLGFVTDASPREQADSLREAHAEVGVLLLALIVLRVIWRLAVPPPPLPDAVTVFQRRTSGAVHRLLYLMLLAMPVSGLAVWMWIGGPITLFGMLRVPLPRLAQDDEFWLSVAGYVHEYGAYAISGLVLLHVSAALWHEFFLRDRLIRDRML
jgi:cytochrome b561